MGGFGTVADNGYGISYIVRGEDHGMYVFDKYSLLAIFLFSVNFSVHSKKSCSATDSTCMLEELRRAFTDMRKLYKL